jgi:endo-1,4-beta-D-glucanase Y
MRDLQVVLAAVAACGQPHSTGPDAASDSAGGDASLIGPHHFGSHGGYHGTSVIFPSNHNQAELDSATAAYYDAWKAQYLVAGCAAGQYRILTSPSTPTYTVSEGHGYGMLIAAIIEGHDPDAHAIFDGLYAYYDAHRSQIDSGLMAWAQDQSCANVQGADSATDGDLDIAYALMLADRQWGSSGAIDYAKAARRIVTSILTSDVDPTGSILVGDWVKSTDTHYGGTRPSDFMTTHFRAFSRFSAMADVVVDHTYAVVDYLQTNDAPATGLLPDFATGAAGAMPTPSPAPPDWLEGADDGAYAYSACRVPWRIATDFVIAGDSRARRAVLPINAWVRATIGDDPSKIVDGYQLDGTALGSTNSLAFVAPFAVAAMVEPDVGTNQAWLDRSWDAIASQPLGDYYGDTIKMLAMIVASGNWWAP